MTSILTWEILSHLASGRLFYAQQPCETEGETGTKKNDAASSSSSAAETATETFVQDAAPASPSASASMAVRVRSVGRLEHDLRDAIVGFGGGRLSISDASLILGVDESVVARRIGDALCFEGSSRGGGGGVKRANDDDDCTGDDSGDDGSKSFRKIFNPNKRRDEYASSSYLRRCLVEEIRDRMDFPSGGVGGVVSVAEIAKALELTAEVVTELISELLDENTNRKIIIRNDVGDDGGVDVIKNIQWMGANGDGSTILPPGGSGGCGGNVGNGQAIVLTDEYDKRMLSQIRGALLGATAPVRIDTLISELEWNPATIIPLLRSSCEVGILRGTLSLSLYTPKIYASMQRSGVDNFFRTNAYITAEKCASMGVQRGKMGDFVRKSFPEALVLHNSVIDMDKICSPLGAAIQTALSNESFADLRSYLPADLSSNEEDVRIIVSDLVIPSVQHQVCTNVSDGLTIIECDVVIYCSAAMKRDAKGLLTPLVEKYGRDRAEEIDEQRRTAEESSSLTSRPRSKETAGGGRKKVKSRQKSGNKSEDSYDIIPLSIVANSVGEKLGLSNLQKDFDLRHGLDRIKPSWSDADSKLRAGPLVEFCRRALLSDELRDMCTRAVRAELDRLVSSRRGVSMSSWAEGAAKAQNMERAFESSFKDLCALVQILAKGAGGAVDTTGLAKHEFLERCGSCFALRVTEFCLFKNGVDAESLVFVSAPPGVPGTLPSFCHPVDFSAMDFPSISVRCTEDKSLLAHFRAILPGSVGVGLGKMWSLCSSDKKGENFEPFLCHLEESCLTLVGIPFSILDKKAERKAMASRRQDIVELLEKSNERDFILRSSVVLIYQQTKNFAVAGNASIFLALQLFQSEKKIPTVVTELLNKVKSNCTVSDSDLSRVKQFGLSKKIKSVAGCS